MRTHWLIVWIIVSFVAACGNDAKPTLHEVKLQGKTMGTWYNITYLDTGKVAYAKPVDSLLKVVNSSMSTYDPNSIISRFNKLDTMEYMRVDEHFKTVYNLAKEVYEATDGAFDPTVMPLVNAYGFGFEKMAEVDSSMIDSLLQLVDFNAIEMLIQRDGDKDVLSLRKSKAGVQLDFSAIAKGYGVDAVGLLLETKGITNYMIEIGGEVRCRGKNSKGQYWRIGIDKPEEGNLERELNAIISLQDESMATSGNYRNYKEINGKKYVHSINPVTGWPELSNTLSATVVAKDCATADAYATAFMVMGYEKALALSRNDPSYSVYLIYMLPGMGVQTTYSTALEDKIQVISELNN